MHNQKSFILGIAGGTGSGKTTVAGKIAGGIGRGEAALLEADIYYKDLSHLPLAERRQMNFDHPDAVDITLLKEHLKALRDGQAIQKPVYQYDTYCRTGDFFNLSPRPLVILEGILIFAIEEISDLFDMKIFIDEDADIRLIRRIRRDIRHRGRTLESVIDQYLSTVRPMYEKFVAPSKQNADLIMDRTTDIECVIETVRRHMKM